MEDRRDNLAETYHNREDTLFHFTRVLSAEDNHLHTLEVYLDGRSRTHAFCETVGRELASIVDNKFGFAKVGELLFSRADKHVMLK